MVREGVFGKGGGSATTPIGVLIRQSHAVLSAGSRSGGNLLNLISSQFLPQSPRPDAAGWQGGVPNSAGFIATIVITYPAAVPANAVYWKYGPSPVGYDCSGAACAEAHWYRMPTAQVAEPHA